MIDINNENIEENITQEDITYENTNKRIRYEQSGGFVDILFFLLTPFIAIISFIFNFVITLKDMLFSEYLIPIKKENGDIKFGSPEGQGYFWSYLWWCIKTSLYLVIFALGGIGFSLVGVLMVYKKLFSKFNISTKDDKDIPYDEKQKLENADLESREAVMVNE
jgi:hypothetical protein